LLFYASKKSFQFNFKQHQFKQERMKLFFKLTFVFLIATTAVNAQTTFTLYDELPAINKLEKPAYSENYPDWAKMLYQYPVNFIEICDRFNDYIKTSAEQKNAIIRYFKNWKQAVEPFVLDDGTIVIPAPKSIHNKNKSALINYRSLQKTVSVNNSNWTFWGPKETIWRNTGNNPKKAGTPAPWQANVYSFDVAPSNKNILYCGTETGYVNKTTNNGVTWEVCAQDYHFGGGVIAVAIDPVNPDVVYVSAAKQIHKSVDGGNTWAPMLSANNIFSASRLIIDPNHHEKLIAATDKGIYISTNGAVSWERKWEKCTWDVEIMPGNSNVIYGISVLRDYYFEMVISKNGGSSFEKNVTFPSKIINKSGGLIAVTPANPNIVYVSMLVKRGRDATTYIYKGTHNNGSWSWVRTKIGKLRSEAGLGGFSTGQGYFDFVLAVSPDNANTVFWGTCSLYRSTDGAVNFTKIGGYGGNFSIHPDMQDIKMLPGGEMWVSTDGGMNYSTDYFKTQQNYVPRIQGLVGTDMWGFDMGWNEDIIVGGRYHNGNTAIADFYEEKSLRMGGAEAPTGWIIKGKSRQAVFSDINKGFGYTLPATKDGIAKGKSFAFSKMPNMKWYGRKRGNILQHHNYHSLIYLGEGTGFWASTDRGATFDLLKSFSGDVMFIQNSFKNPDYIYADVEGKGLYKSEDAGKTWLYKPSLTNIYGKKSWAGKLHFVVSPYDENTVYACPQKRWANWDSKVFKSTDGGTTWKDWSGSINPAGYSKCLAIQPTKTGDDLVYLFISAQNSTADAVGKVYYRKAGMDDWELYNNNYPAGMLVNMALPFYRDSKLRVAGKGGVWESPMQEPDYTPILNMWVDKPESNCLLDTFFCDDHSMLNHEGATWEWQITPEPAYISDVNSRNPKIVPGAAGSYNVTMEVTQNGHTFSKTIENMFSVTKCPTVDNCSNPGTLDKSKWRLMYTDSEESDRPASDAFDDDLTTFWHTEWRYRKPEHPHQIQIDLGESYNIHKLAITNRSNSQNGWIKEYKIYISENKNSWGEVVKTGAFGKSVNPQPIKFSNPPVGRYLKIVALSEVNNEKFTTIAEITITGCYKNATEVTNVREIQELKAFPVPTTGIVNLSVPVGNNLKYNICSITGQTVLIGEIRNSASQYAFDLSTLNAGVYFIYMKNKNGIEYRAKVIKQ
jgi:photosystem II stability/assembly factor-like uncharacterized protein